MGEKPEPPSPQTGSEPAWTGLNRPEPGESSQKCQHQSRGVTKVKNLLPMLRKKLIFFCFSCSVGITICHFWHPSAVILPKQKWQFGCGGVEKIENVLPMLRKKHFFLCFPCSMGITFLKSTWPLVYKWHFLRGGEFAYSCGAVHGFVGRYRMTNSFENFPAKSAVHAT